MPEHDEIDLSAVDWKATAENLQREVTRLTCDQSMPAFVEWFRNDLLYKAPEEWPSRIEWFLNELVDRYAPVNADVELNAAVGPADTEPAQRVADDEIGPHKPTEGQEQATATDLLHPPDPKMWGLHRTPELDRLIDIVHNALFYEDEKSGPVFAWTDTRLCLDDDPLLGCAADQVAFALLDRRSEVLALIAAITGSELAA